MTDIINDLIGSASSHITRFNLEIPVPTTLLTSHKRFLVVKHALGISNTQLTIAAIIIYILLKRIRRSFLTFLIRRKLNAVRERKRTAQRNEIASVKRYTNDTELLDSSVLNYNADEIVQRVQSKQLSATTVASTFITQAIHTHHHTNCCTEMLFSAAIQQAQLIDQQPLPKLKKLRLAGVVISIKDSVGVQGVDSSLGLTRYCTSWPSDALIVTVMKQQGAVIHTKTNIPQTLLSFENKNPIWGVTTNPYNKNYTSGGSSGGEVAMIASRASVVGIGTDIGGSVRIPAHFSGTYALKPTSRRLSLKGFRPSVPGQDAVPGVAGVMANTVNDIILVLRELWTKQCWDADHDLIPLSLDTTECANDGKLVVGYYLDDGVAAVSPPCRRAVLETVEALRAAGHTVVEFKPPSIADAIVLYYQLMTADGSDTISEQLKGEIYEDYSSTLIATVNQPKWLKSLVAGIAKYLLKDPVAARLTLATGKRSIQELWKVQYHKKAYRQEFFDAWQAHGNRFDVVLSPAHALPAVPHGSFKNISFACSYTMLYNLLDLPAGVVPVTAVDPSKDQWNSKPKGVLEARLRQQYNADKMAGLPIGVQIAGLPMEDETVLRAMRQISDLMQFNHRPATAPKTKSV